MDQPVSQTATPAVSPFDQSFQPVIDKYPPVTVDDEIEALKRCLHALQPVAHDKSAVRRIYDYLQQRFPSTRSANRGRDDI